MTHKPFPEFVRSGEWRQASNPVIPVLPALAHEAIAVAADPEVTIAQLSHVVSKDPTLATRVIHLANAAYCAPLQTVTTLPDAIVRMGTAAVRNLVITACLASRGGDPRVYGPAGRNQTTQDRDPYMAHVVAERWAGPRRSVSRGLLHDVGKLLPEAGARLRQAGGPALNRLRSPRPSRGGRRGPARGSSFPST